MVIVSTYPSRTRWISTYELHGRKGQMIGGRITAFIVTMSCGDRMGTALWIGLLKKLSKTPRNYYNSIGKISINVIVVLFTVVIHLFFIWKRIYNYAYMSIVILVSKRVKGIGLFQNWRLSADWELYTYRWRFLRC